MPFDLRMLRQCWARHSIDPFEAAIYLDILPIFRAFNKESSTPAPNAKLEDLCKFYKVRPGEHKADSDVRAYYSLLQKVLGQNPETIAMILLELATRRC